jgi:Cytochrome P460
MVKAGVAFGVVVLAGGAVALAFAAETRAANAPLYTAEGRLEFPQAYRQWIYLTSGMDMSYSPEVKAGTPVFDNVFVNPAAHESFLRTGTWPDKTILVLEVRAARQDGSINRRGHFQTDVAHIEVHVKDVARFDGGWAFFGFRGEAPATMIPRTNTCYSCHRDHGAVDTTFVQFYPTLLPIAREKRTLSPAFAAQEAGGAARN